MSEEEASAIRKAPHSTEDDTEAQPAAKKLRTETGDRNGKGDDDANPAKEGGGNGGDAEEQAALDATRTIIEKTKALQEAKALAQKRINEMMSSTLKGAGEISHQQPQAAQITQPQAAQVSNPGCRLYVGSLHYDLTEADVRKVFAPFGVIQTIVMSFEPMTNRSRGYCFIEYTEPESAQLALDTMNGFELVGRPIKVGRPNAGAGSSQASGAAMRPPGNPMLGLAQLQYMQNAAAYGQNQGGGGHYGAAGLQQQQQQQPPGSRIYVGSIAFEITPDIVRRLFESFGRIRTISLLPDPQQTPGRLHRGYGFIEFDDERAAATAIQSMNGFNLCGRPIKVGPAHSAGAPPAASAPPAYQQQGGIYGSGNY